MEQDGTFEEKLDGILACLYEAYEKQFITDNITDAFVHNTHILTYLIKRFTDKNINLGMFLDRLKRDEKIVLIDLAGIGTNMIKLSPVGVDFITSGNSYVKKAELEKQKTEMKILLLKSQIETNGISKITNRYIAVFTGAAGLWYIHDFLTKVLPNKLFNNEFIALPVSLVSILVAMRIISNRNKKMTT